MINNFAITIIFSLLVVGVSCFINFKIVEDTNAVMVKPGTYISVKYNNPSTVPAVMYIYEYRSQQKYLGSWK